MLQLTDAEYARFHRVLMFTIPHEGGYVNDPDDPGGETKWGISKRYHPNVDIKNLTPEQAAEIYYNEYYIPSGANLLEEPFSTVVFDTAVQLGAGLAKKWFDQVKGNLDDFIQLRKNYYILKVKQNPAKQKYLAGWLNRCDDLDKYAIGAQVLAMML